MNEHVIYYVALGQKHRDWCVMTLESLYIKGYQGDCVIVTDQAWVPTYAPTDKVTFEVVSPVANHFEAKKHKASAGIALATSPKAYDAILFLDCDTLISKDITPLMARIEQNPQTFFVSYTSNRRLMRTSLTTLFSDEEKATYADHPMIDSYAVGFAPTPANVQLMQDWDHANTHTVCNLKWLSDAFGLNYAVVKSGRMNDIVFMDECERLNGKPKADTIVEHYIYGSHVRMPAVYQNEILRPYFEAKHSAPTSNEEVA